MGQTAPVGTTGRPARLRSLVARATDHSTRYALPHLPLADDQAPKEIPTMSNTALPNPSGRRVVVAAGTLWGGGVATAIVAALIAAVGVLICHGVLDIKMVESPLLLPVGDSYALNYAATAFVMAIAATGVAHLLAVTTPRPAVFFRWIVGLVTLAAVAMPFASEGSLAGKVSAATINLFIGIAIGSLLSAVLARAIVRSDRP